MRILRIPEEGGAQDGGRIDSLEKVAASILQRLQSIEERISDLEKSRSLPVSAPPAISAPAAPPVQATIPVAAPTPTPAAKPVAVPPPPPALNVDSEAMKKNLLTKMWTYLNDKAA